jgi:uncharacterized protein (UPF0262 family)
MPGNEDKNQLVNITLDEKTLARAAPDVEHERKVAIFDLLEDNFFKLENKDSGPYQLHLSIVEGRLMFDIYSEAEEHCLAVILSLSSFRRIVKDYFLVCESYFAAIKTSTPSQIEAIDMGRRGLHDEGSQILKERLDGKIEIDFPTARRLFTLVCVLHWKG